MPSQKYEIAHTTIRFECEGCGPDHLSRTTPAQGGHEHGRGAADGLGILRSACCAGPLAGMVMPAKVLPPADARAAP